MIAACARFTWASGQFYLQPRMNTRFSSSLARSPLRGCAAPLEHRHLMAVGCQLVSRGDADDASADDCNFHAERPRNGLRIKGLENREIMRGCR